METLTTLPNFTVPITSIKVGSTNPRKIFDKRALAELTDSVRAHGVLQPIRACP